MESGTHNMSDTPTILEVNAETGDEVVRDLTAKEIKEIKDLKKEQDAQQKLLKASRESALAKLIDLGLTAEEIAAL
jgi:DNA-binding NarL/FixJ family response regulator